MPSLPEVFAPSLNRTVKLGALLGRPRGPRFKFARYARARLDAPPALCDYSNPNTSTAAALQDIYGNDTLGDCFIAMLYHWLAVWTGNTTGTALHVTLDQIVATYSAITGYQPGNPSTDMGTDPEVGFNYVIQNGLPPSTDKPLAVLSLDATNKTELMQAIDLFEGCSFCIGLPDAIVKNMPSGDGFVWDVSLGAANMANGHAFLGDGYGMSGYNADGVQIDTWGLKGLLTWSAIAAWGTSSAGGRVDVLLSPSMILKASGKSPTGMDWTSLVADFDAMGGSVPVPTAPALPPAAPTPSSVTPTLALAQNWATAGINAHGTFLMTKNQAIAAANAGLLEGWPQG
jgi:hypothetical protein